MDQNKPLFTRTELEAAFDLAIIKGSFVDVHVHDMPSCCGPNLSLRGPDHTIAYHYLYGEVFGELGLRPEKLKAFWELSLERQVDFLIDNSFANNELPVSEARLGILTAAKSLGLSTDSGDFKQVLREWRTLYSDLGEEKYTTKILKLAGLSKLISTQSPFVQEECRLYLNDKVIEEWDSRYWVGLRWDEFIYKPELARQTCAKFLPQFDACGDLKQPAVQSAARKLFEFWLDRLPNVKYVAISLPGSSCLTDRTSRITQTLETVLIPVAQERGLPIFLMPFVRRGLNPSFHNAGDCVERGDIDDLIRFVSTNLDVNFGITPLSANDNYHLAFATRALPNLRVWGHWWGNLNPSLIEQQLRMRLEFNGYVHYGVNSDARILDQLLFKWPHYWRVLKRVIIDRCLDIIELSQWPVTASTIENSIRKLQDHDRILFTKDRK